MSAAAFFQAACTQAPAKDTITRQKPWQPLLRTCEIPKSRSLHQTTFTLFSPSHSSPTADKVPATTTAAATKALNIACSPSARSKASSSLFHPHPREKSACITDDAGQLPPRESGEKTKGERESSRGPLDASPLIRGGVGRYESTAGGRDSESRTKKFFSFERMRIHTHTSCFTE